MPLRNVILSTLTEAELARIRLQSIRIEADSPLATDFTSLRTVLLPETCVISVLKQLRDGQVAASAFVGYEGYAAPMIAGSVFGRRTTLVCHVQGDAWQMEIDQWEKLANSASWRGAVQTAERLLAEQMLQLYACRSMHAMRGRTASFLLLLADKAETLDLPLTHEALASMLGVRRPTASLAIEWYAAQGVLETGHRRVSIVDRQRLVASSCGCYEEIEYHRNAILTDGRVPR